jgi:hypothetical protein
MTISQLKQALDEKAIEYPSSAKKNELVEILERS